MRPPMGYQFGPSDAGMVSDLMSQHEEGKTGAARGQYGPERVAPTIGIQIHQSDIEGTFSWFHSKLKPEATTVRECWQVHNMTGQVQ